MAKTNQAKLFGGDKSDSSGYSAKDIEVLEGLEHGAFSRAAHAGDDDEFGTASLL